MAPTAVEVRSLKMGFVEEPDVVRNDEQEVKMESCSGQQDEGMVVVLDQGASRVYYCVCVGELKLRFRRLSLPLTTSVVTFRICIHF